MNKQELKLEVKRRVLEKNRYVYTKDINLIVDEVFNIIIDTLANDENVNINRFGKFHSTDVSRYYGRDPQKPKHVIAIPAHKRVTFRAGSEFKDRVNRK